MSDEEVLFDPATLKETGNRYTDQFIAAARDLDLTVEVIDRRRALVVIKGRNKSMTVRAAIVGCNNLVAARMASNKSVTNASLHRAGVRVPPFQSVIVDGGVRLDNLTERLQSFASAHYPVVLKAEKGHGGTNVFAGLADADDLQWAAQQLVNSGLTSLLVEKHIAGRNYRIKMFDGVVIDIIARMPGAIKGDGEAPISELIDRLDKRRIQESIPPIPITAKLLRLIARSGYTLESVLDRGVLQPIGIECNEGSGGYSKKMPVDCLSPEAVAAFSNVADKSGLRYLAVDFICDDIAAEDSHLTGYVNEVNSAPVINEYIEGKSREWYLSYARNLLVQYFDLNKKAQIN